MENTTAYNEESLIRQMAGGSKKAFEEIYSKNFTSIYYFARRFVNDQQAAEDITTDTFLKLWERLSNFDSLPAIKSFLHTTAKNACLNYLRNEQNKSANYERLCWLLAEASDETLAEQEITGRVYQYVFYEIEKLPPQQKKVFTMAYIDGLSNEEIATQLQIHNQSVR